MKKILFLASLAAVAMTSCTSESNEYVGGNDNTPKEIAFMPINQKATRAAVQGTTFPTANTMEVKAYQTQPSAVGYFDKTTYKYQYAAGASTGSGTTWGGDPARYWPLSPAKLNFFAVSCAGVDAADITIANALASAEVKYKTTGNTSANTYSETTQSDIMYAFNRAAVTESSHALVFPASVGMEFKHALALINFQIKAGNDASKAIKIKKIELNGARYTGTLAITNTNAATVADTWSAIVDWTPDAVVDNVVVPNIGNTETPVALTTSFVPTNADPATASDWASLMIIPTQQKAASPISYGFTTIKITYVLDNKEYTYEYAPAGWTDDDSNAATPDVPNYTYVTAGTKYTYQITMTLHEILILPTVDAWDDATGSPFAVGI